MELPPNLIQEVKNGNVILFLGAGAAYGAISQTGETMLGVSDLIGKMSDRFLGGAEKDNSLAVVSELCISESDLVSVQYFIKELFEKFEPADFHKSITRFRWKCIYTTNYDLVIEKAYQCSKCSIQNLVPIYRSSDRLDQLIRNNNDLEYVKLHGCITQIKEECPPLILSIDQYVTHRSKRETLFERLKDKGSDSTIIFAGHGLEDPDIRQILSEVTAITSSRPRYYAVTPGFSEMHSRMWESKRVTLIRSTFEDFLISLDDSITDVERKYVPRTKNHQLEKYFISNQSELTENALETLKYRLNYIHTGMSIESCDAKAFYHGYSKGWGAIQSKFDVPRVLNDDFISQVILSEEHDRATKFELYLLAGSAGSGKSIMLKRLAWSSGIDYEKICLYCKSDEKLDIDTLIEIADKVGERIFVFVDRAAIHVSELLLLSNRLKKSESKITIILAERTNEWNMECQALHSLIADRFKVEYLRPREIEALISKLDEHNCLGVLKGKPKEVQVEAFSKKAGRQLLVALYEATMAKRFQDIVQDEYSNIVPEKAKLIYRTVCVMNRIGVPVRAGIINRIHGVTFEEFQSSFFLPLENVVKTSKFNFEDYAYEARHPWIAEMVFTHSNKDERDRLQLYLSLIGALDIGYRADRTAFRELIKYKHLASLFNDLTNIEKIYDSAYIACGDDDYFYQQRAIFNMRSDLKRFTKAEQFLNLASKFGAYNKSIKHTWAELELARAVTSKGLERDKFLNKASSLASEYTGNDASSSHGYFTLCKIAIIRLSEAIEENDDELIVEATQAAEKQVRLSLQSFPDDEHILNQEAGLAKLLLDSSRAEKALLKAFNINSKNSFIASSLSDIFLRNSDRTAAKNILAKVLDENPGDKIAHSKMAKILSRYEPDKNLDAEYHWQRSFTDGDTNYLNQLWYARQLYINDKFDEYLSIVAKLRQLKLPPETRHNVRGFLRKNSNEKVLVTGRVVQKEATYTIIKSSDYDGTHFLHRKNCPEKIWEDISLNSELSYNLGFTFSGVAASISIPLK